MAEEQSPDGTGPDDLPEPIDEWIAARAEEEGIPEGELVSRLLRADDGVGGNATGERLGAVEEAVAALRTDLDEKIEDVRGRVVQIKREVDGKAPADHDHPALEERIERAADGDGVSVPHPDTGERDGAANALEHLVETADELEHKLDRLARVTVDLRGVVHDLARSEAEDAAVADLARSANVHGARRGDCGSCGETVDLGLLSEPRCPHCAEPFEAFVPGRGLFGSHTLEVGSHPALERTDDLETVARPDAGPDEEEEDSPRSGIEFGDAGTSDGDGEERTDGRSAPTDEDRSDDWPESDEWSTPVHGASHGRGMDADPGDGEADEDPGSPRRGDG